MAFHYFLCQNKICVWFCLFLSVLCCHSKAETRDSKKEVRSFSIFDTLVGKVGTPQSLFATVERKFPLPGFAKVRMLSERRTDGSLDDIYKTVVAMMNLSFKEGKKLRAFELKTELEQLFPIVSNVSKVQEGDILVANSYHNIQELKQILNRVGITKKVHIVTAREAKEKTWAQLRDKHACSSRFARKLDAAALTFGEYSNIEQKVYDAGQTDLADVMRALRLLNPYPKKSLHWAVWNEQSQWNVPVLVLGSQAIEKVCQEMKLSSLLFTARGCCHLIKIFKALFPNYKTEYLHSSRHVYLNPTHSYVRYFMSLYTPETLIVDEWGRNVSCRKFFIRFYSSPPRSITLVGAPQNTSCIIRGFDSNIERLNYDLVGSLISYNSDGPVRAPLEYKIEDVKPAHNCIDKCVVLLQHYRCGEVNTDLLKDLITEIEHRLPVLDHHHVPFHH